MGRHMTILLLACMAMKATASFGDNDTLPVSNITEETDQKTMREELAKLTAEITVGTAHFGEKLRRLTAKFGAETDLKDQTLEIKNQGQMIQQQGLELKAQGDYLKVQGQAVEKIANDLKLHGTQLKELVDVIEDLGTSFRDLRKGIVHELDNQDKKIEWAITDGSLAPRNTSWVETNFQAMLSHVSNQQRQMDHLQEQMDDLTLFIKKSNLPGCSAADKSGVYNVVRYGLKMEAYCHVDETGKWTVIQRRQDGSVDFHRNWANYTQGFGDVAGEHWLGNDNIHALTSAGVIKLRIDVEDWENNKHTVYYNVFHVAGPEDKYQLTVSGYVGSDPPGDSLTIHNGKNFSTEENDNDGDNAHNWSSKSGGGGWWYDARTNLNGAYNGSSEYSEIYWATWRGYDYSLKATTMMLRKP